MPPVVAAAGAGATGAGDGMVRSSFVVARVVNVAWEIDGLLLFWWCGLIMRSLWSLVIIILSVCLYERASRHFSRVVVDGQIAPNLHWLQDEFFVLR